MTPERDCTTRIRLLPLAAFLMVFGLLFAAVPAMAQDQAEEPPPEPVTTGDPLVETEILSLQQLPLTAEELAIEAKGWQDLLKAKNQEIAEAEIEVRELEGDAATQRREQIAELAAERDQIARNYLQSLAGWEIKGGAPEEVAAFRQYQLAITAEELRVTDFQTLVKKAMAWVTDDEGGLQLGRQILVIVIALVVLVIVARVIRRFARRLFERIPDMSTLLQAFVVGVVYWITLAFGLMIVLQFLGINITPLFALFGGAAFILAFAMQDTIANLASGLMIMMNRPFDVGDFVDTAGINGTIESVSIASTTLVTPDNQRHIVPNKVVWSSIITNVTSSETRRVDLVFGIGYADDIEAARKVMEEVVAAHPLTLDDPAPVIRVHELADSSVNFVCRPWSKTSDYWTVYWDLTQQVKQAFDQAGISIPFPQRDVHVHQVASP
ncbi:MAG: mechanosensitive ion channel domain-containing protein [Pseudomonadota bacterium]